MNFRKRHVLRGPVCPNTDCSCDGVCGGHSAEPAKEIPDNLQEGLHKIIEEGFQRRHQIIDEYFQRRRDAIDRFFLEITQGLIFYRIEERAKQWIQLHKTELTLSDGRKILGRIKDVDKEKRLVTIGPVQVSITDVTKMELVSRW